MRFGRFFKFRFSVKSLLIFTMGIAIGFSLNLRTLKLLTGVASNEAYRTVLPAYQIEPPDVLDIAVTDSQGSAAVSGQFLVNPDGRVRLDGYGEVIVAGLTIADAKTAIESALAKKLSAPRVTVDVFASNSKVYYVVVQKNGTAEQIVRLPITGNETALDALAQLALPTPRSARLWISRPSQHGVGSERVLPLHWSEVARGAWTTENYQLFPGDRLFVSMD